MNFKKILPQLLTLVVVILVFGFFSYNAQVNMENRGITFGYGFLSQESSFDGQFFGTFKSFRAVRWALWLEDQAHLHCRAHDLSTQATS